MTYHYVLDRIVGPDPNIRAADADRERIAERLRRAHAEGRLDLTEFQQRLESCYEARTFGQLRELVSDLPRQDERSERRSVHWFGLRPRRLGALAPLLIALILISAVTGHHVFWLWIPLAFLVWRMTWWRRRVWASPRRGPDDWL